MDLWYNDTSVVQWWREDRALQGQVALFVWVSGLWLSHFCHQQYLYISEGVHVSNIATDDFVLCRNFMHYKPHIENLMYISTFLHCSKDCTQRETNDKHA